ncbi:MAG: hypothetical protein KTU85_12915 [Acidimicrobiia bacterium]|nr:hypothetical protein [Acidimicrobiia bacterium]
MHTDTTSILLAHQGGWDEILIVGAPMVLFASLLLVARRRARTRNTATVTVNDD